METKTVDSKGRLTLGPEFAGKTVILKKTKTGLQVVPAVVIPEHELWLAKNKKARGSVERGLAQARSRKFVKHPPKFGDALE